MSRIMKIERLDPSADIETIREAAADLHRTEQEIRDAIQQGRVAYVQERTDCAWWCFFSLLDADGNLVASH